MNSSKSDSPSDFRQAFEHRLAELEDELSQKNRIIEKQTAQIAILNSANEKLKRDKEVYDEVIDYIVKGAEKIIEATEEDP